jgi:hypothetical protein
MHWESEEERWLRYAPAGAPDECWEWRGHRLRRGYGLFTYQGRRMPASRAALLRSGVTIPDGMIACHHCDNPPCVNPDHLYVGTHKTNSDDKHRRGRANMPRGARHPRVKLTVEQVREIHRRYTESGVTQDALALEFQVSQRSIHRIVHGLQQSEALTSVNA